MVQDGKFSLDVVGQSPLRRFKGVLKAYIGVPGKDEQSGREQTSVQFDFTEVEPLESVEPYPFPVAQISIGYNIKAGTRWGGFAKSIRRVGPTMELHDLVGKRQEWAMLPYAMRTLNRETNEWGDGEQSIWQVVAVEGVEPPENLNNYIAEIADGKMDKDIYQQLFQDQKVISRPDIVTAITDRKLLDTLVNADFLERDANGVYHKKVKVAS